MVARRLVAYLLGVYRHRPSPPKWRGLDGATYRGWMAPAERARDGFLAEVRRERSCLTLLQGMTPIAGPLLALILDMIADRHGLERWRADADLTGRVRDILWDAERP